MPLLCTYSTLMLLTNRYETACLPIKTYLIVNSHGLVSTPCLYLQEVCLRAFTILDGALRLKRLIRTATTARGGTGQTICLVDVLPRRSSPKHILNLFLFLHILAFIDSGVIFDWTLISTNAALKTVPSEGIFFGFGAESYSEHIVTCRADYRCLVSRTSHEI